MEKQNHYKGHQKQRKDRKTQKLFRKRERSKNMAGAEHVAGAEHAADIAPAAMEMKCRHGSNRFYQRRIRGAISQ